MQPGRAAFSAPDLASLWSTASRLAASGRSILPPALPACWATARSVLPSQSPRRDRPARHSTGSNNSTPFIFNTDGFAALSYALSSNYKLSAGIRADYYANALTTYNTVTGGTANVSSGKTGPKTGDKSAVHQDGTGDRKGSAGFKFVERLA